MRACLVVLLVLSITLAKASDCPCQDPSNCVPAQVPARKQVYGFSVKNGYWPYYDWDVVTTVAWNQDSELMCFAHSKGAYVVSQAPFKADILGNSTAEDQWLSNLLSEALAHNLDGTNFDYESAMALQSSIRPLFTALVQKTANAFRQAIPHAQISVDVAWGPYDVDGRNYDYLGLAEAADYLFVMAYDTRSQITGRCIACANTPLYTATRGIEEYLDVGVPANQLILGLPWYGYDYPCLSPMQLDDTYCPIKAVPFRGAPCSDASGHERPYADIMNQLAANSTVKNGPIWDDVVQAHYFNYISSDESGNQIVHQVWYDDPKSLSAKYQVATDNSLAGIGFWTFDFLAYDSPDPREQEQTKAMWDAVAAYVNN